MSKVMRKDITSVDVVILGAGGGGSPAALLLARAGLQVLMADPFGNLGGECLAEGCVPSKAVRVRRTTEPGGCTQYPGRRAVP